jgi:hypothetical protein
VAKLSAYGNIPLIKWHYNDYPTVKYCLRSDGKILRNYGTHWQIAHLKPMSNDPLIQIVERIKCDPKITVVTR